jgi:hypothetical protein
MNLSKGMIVRLILISIIIISIALYNSSISKDIEDNTYSTIVKVTGYSRGPAGRNYIQYKYYYNNKSYKDKVYAYDKVDEYLNRYFKVNLSTKNPNHLKFFGMQK